ncbi:MAG: PilZ domain-containing protein [Acidobacteriota bacterium]
MSLYTVVKVKEDSSKEWKEVADIISVSASGAGFFLARPCEVGRLVNLMMPLPAHLRSYDHDKELYRVWGLVQHCYEVSNESGKGFQVGVAFVGKDSPASYKKDPNTSYRISGMGPDGLWKVTETKGVFKKRRDMRYWTTVELYLALVDSKKDAVSGERTIAENISRSGAAVLTTLDVNVGDRVKFISEKYDFSGLAVVCNCQESDDKRKRLHLQFVEAVFPVNRLAVVASETKE